jgi:hypothetical protein
MRTCDKIRGEPGRLYLARAHAPDGWSVIYLTFIPRSTGIPAASTLSRVRLTRTRPSSPGTWCRRPSAHAALGAEPSSCMAAFVRDRRSDPQGAAAWCVAVAAESGSGADGQRLNAEPRLPLTWQYGVWDTSLRGAEGEHPGDQSRPIANSSVDNGRSREVIFC